VHPGRETSMHYFSSSGGTDTDSRKSAIGRVKPNLCFCMGGICGSRSALQCVWCVKHRHAIFHAHVGPVRILKKRVGTPYAKLVFFHSVGSAGHIGIAEHLEHETSMHYFCCSGGTDTNSIKNALGHIMSNLCFCIRWDLWVT
jgi:hypothetical protein